MPNSCLQILPEISRRQTFVPQLSSTHGSWSNSTTSILERRLDRVRDHERCLKLLQQRVNASPSANTTFSTISALYERDVRQTVFSQSLCAEQGQLYTWLEFGYLLLLRFRRLHYASESAFKQMPRIIPYNSEILVCVQHGNLNGLKELLVSGKGSVYDVDPYGLGLLYVRLLTRRQTELMQCCTVCELLLLERFG